MKKHNSFFKLHLFLKILIVSMLTTKKNVKKKIQSLENFRLFKKVSNFLIKAKNSFFRTFKLLKKSSLSNNFDRILKKITD